MNTLLSKFTNADWWIDITIGALISTIFLALLVILYRPLANKIVGLCLRITKRLRDNKNCWVAIISHSTWEFLVKVQQTESYEIKNCIYNVGALILLGIYDISKSVFIAFLCGACLLIAFAFQLMSSYNRRIIYEARRHFPEWNDPQPNIHK